MSILLRIMQLFLSLLSIDCLFTLRALLACIFVELCIEMIPYCWCICEPMYRGPCIGSIYPILLGFGGIHLIILLLGIS